MHLKPNWTEYLHRFRARQFHLIFAGCPINAFPRALEIGAGDGFQSRLLRTRVSSLVCTELNPNRLQRTPVDGITYRICDAECIDDYFPPRSFDLVFSSNLLEHLPDVHSCLRGVKSCLRDDGIAIHLMPNRIWKLCSLLLPYPSKLVDLLERVTAVDRDRPLRLELHQSNLKSPSSTCRFKVLPSVHGVSHSHFQEFLSFSKSRWVSVFEQCGYELARVSTSPFSSGFGFGFDRVRSVVERFGVGSEHIFVVNKRGFSSPWLRYFDHLA